jgi:hypothetical protein
LRSYWIHLQDSTTVALERIKESPLNKSMEESQNAPTNDSSAA